MINTFYYIAYSILHDENTYCKIDDFTDAMAVIGVFTDRAQANAAAILEELAYNNWSVDYDIETADLEDCYPYGYTRVLNVQKDWSTELRNYIKENKID